MVALFSTRMCPQPALHSIAFCFWDRFQSTSAPATTLQLPRAFNATQDNGLSSRAPLSETIPRIDRRPPLSVRGMSLAQAPECTLGLRPTARSLDALASHWFCSGVAESLWPYSTPSAQGAQGVEQGMMYDHAIIRVHPPAAP